MNSNLYWAYLCFATLVIAYIIMMIFVAIIFLAQWYLKFRLKEQGKRCSCNCDAQK